MVSDTNVEELLWWLSLGKSLVALARIAGPCRQRDTRSVLGASQFSPGNRDVDDHLGDGQIEINPVNVPTIVQPEEVTVMLVHIAHPASIRTNSQRH